MTKEYLLKVINAEVSYDEIEKLALDDSVSTIIDKIFKKKDRFYLDVFVDVCNKYLNKEINQDYFDCWLSFLMKFLGKKYENFTDYLDCFCNYGPIDERECRHLIHIFKDFYFQKNNRHHFKLHRKNKMKIMYLKDFSWFRESGEIYIAYFVDYENKMFDIRFVNYDDLDFDLNKNYSFFMYSKYDDINGKGDAPEILRDEYELQYEILEFKRDKNIIF